MAFLYDPSSGKETDENEGEGRPTSTPGGGTGAGGNPTAAARPTNSGNFTNIQNYLRANQGSGLGQKVQSNIQNQAGQVSGDVQKNQQETSQQQTSAFQPYQGANEFIQNTLQTAGQEEQGPDAVNRYRTLTAGQYKGPQDLQNYSTLQNQAQNVKGLANLGNTESGRFALLRNQFNNGGYSQGQQTLDNLLLQQQGGNLSAAKRSANQANQQLAQARTGVQNQAKDYGQQVAATSEAAQTGLSNAQTGLQTDLQKRVADAKAAQDTLYGRIKTQLGSLGKGDTEIDPDIMGQLQTGLGVNPEGSLYNVNPLTYVQAAEAPKVQTIANAGDYSRYKALQNLANQDTTLLSDPSQAGTYTPLMFQKQNYADAQKRGESIYNKDQDRLTDEGAVNSGKELNREVGYVNDVQKQYDDIRNSPEYQQFLAQRSSSMNPGQVQISPELQQRIDAVNPNTNMFDYLSNSSPYSPGYTGAAQELLNRGTFYNLANSKSLLQNPDYKPPSSDLDAGTGFGTGDLSQWYNNGPAQNLANYEAKLKEDQNRLGYFQKLKQKMNQGV